ncbi:MAG: 2-methylisocitrate lyase [Betaproteobacteria bacterium]|nr:2-methylisocitrate lyase [Betaproteobacteria bacterium]
MPNLRELISRDELTVAPFVMSPMMARMAQAAGFRAGYLSGGSLGWWKCITEANITLPEMASVCTDIRAACDLPMVLDGGAGWGDPVHMHRTIALTQAAGFAAIEIEDQVLPRRVEHHLGIDHLVPLDFMLNRLREAIAARTDPNLMIIARTNASRVAGMGIDEAIRRGEAFKKAGADMLFIWSANPEDLRKIGERLEGPLMLFLPRDGLKNYALSEADLVRLGYRLGASPGNALAAIVNAVRQSYESLAQSDTDPTLGKGGAQVEMKAAYEFSDLARLVEIERRTMKE